jgi:BirA family biotin operon repressor/biotin-[acetyl-CoA-carboxylase] ligase
MHLSLQWFLMNEDKLRSMLPIAGLGIPLHVFASTGSTNDICVELARDGAPHGTLVMADEQRAGRGRSQRKWITRSGSALAMSVLLRPASSGTLRAGYFTLLGALAVVEALDNFGVQARIKWPNDVVVDSGKLAGLLAEASWSGDVLDFVVLGIGVNVTPDSLPPAAELDFPAACVEASLGEAVEREALAALILSKLSAGLDQADPRQLVRRLEEQLAYREQVLEIENDGRSYQGRIEGLQDNGALRVLLPGGVVEQLGITAHIRPVDLRVV